MNIYKSNGQYIAFVDSQSIFSWNGEYLGWINGNDYAWDKDGNFRGKLTEIGGNYYIIRNKYTISPVPKVPRVAPSLPVVPTPKGPVSPITLSIGEVDGF